MANDTGDHKTYFLGENSKIKMSAKTLITLILSVMTVVGMITKLQFENSQQDKDIEKLQETVERMRGGK